MRIEVLFPWYASVYRNLPWRTTKQPYAIWISEIMLQQTRVESVIPYYIRFLETFPTVKALAESDESLLLKRWEGLGYYSRARNLKKAALHIMERFNGAFPNRYEDILSLPGVGPYTAGAIASIAFEQKVAAVDGNVLRVYARLMRLEEDIGKEKIKKAVKIQIEKWLIPSYGELNQALMELGATVCTPHRPQCTRCPLVSQCKAYLENKTSDYPKKTRKKTVQYREKTVLFYLCKNKIYLRKRKEALLKGMMEPVVINRFWSEDEIENDAFERKITILSIRSLEQKIHVFSHQTWMMKGYIVEVSHLPIDEGAFYTPETIEKDIALATCFQKMYLQL